MNANVVCAMSGKANVCLLTLHCNDVRVIAHAVLPLIGPNHQMQTATIVLPFS